MKNFWEKLILEKLDIGAKVLILGPKMPHILGKIKIPLKNPEQSILINILQKSSQLMIMGPKMPYLPNFGYNKNFSKIWKDSCLPINACHSVQFHKNLMKIFRKKVQKC